MAKLSNNYFRNQDVEFLAQDLLGKMIYTNKDGEITAGMITETEAYFGVEDKASHAFGNRRTPRTEIMYSKGGVAYVYLCYGIHYLLNIVTSESDDPKCVLIRAILPYSGISVMEKRRSKKANSKNFSTGPGTVTKVLGIDMTFNKETFDGDRIWIENIGIKINKKDIKISERVGISYAQEHALLPLRFRVSDVSISEQLKNLGTNS